MLESLLRPKSLRELMVSSWIIPGAMAIIASAAVFFVSGWLDYQNSLKRTQFALEEKSSVAARRLSAEVVLGNKGAVETVSRQLKDELNLEGVSVITGENPCGSGESCFKPLAGLLSRFVPIPFQDRGYFLRAELRSPELFRSLNLRLFAWVALPLILIFSAGLFWQRRQFRKFVFEPIQKLTDPENLTLVDSSTWPAELRLMSEGLKASISAREQAIFGQMASGLVHDIKTLVQGIFGALNLAREVPEIGEKRSKRLELLFKACDRNLPKINGIIGITLDGVREISVRPTIIDLADIVSSSRDNLADFISRSEVEFEEILETKRVFAEGTQLERVLTNIIKNAIEVLHERTVGQVRLIRVVSHSENELDIIRIQDSGNGIAGDAAQVFRPLRSEKVHGAGLGLFVSRKIVEAHGGRLFANSRGPLGGAEFVIELPTHTGDRNAL